MITVTRFPQPDGLDSFVWGYSSLGETAVGTLREWIRQFCRLPVGLGSLIHITNKVIWMSAKGVS